MHAGDVADVDAANVRANMFVLTESAQRLLEMCDMLVGSGVCPFECTMEGVEKVVNYARGFEHYQSRHADGVLQEADFIQLSEEDENS